MLNSNLDIGTVEITEEPRFGHASHSPVSIQGRGLEALLHQATRESDRVTADHLGRMGQYTILIAEQLGLSEDLQKQYYFAGLLHDIGKLAIPRCILQKPGCLTRSERATMSTHTLIGANMLRGCESPYLKVLTEVALCHHEHWDGSGYPYGLSAHAIPLSARVVAVCDVYDALRCQRPYKDAYSHDAALDKLCHGDGWTMPEHFDPDVLSAFLTINGRFDDVYTGSVNV